MANATTIIQQSNTSMAHCASLLSLSLSLSLSLLEVIFGDTQKRKSMND
jgi:hypothetical protein